MPISEADLATHRANARIVAMECVLGLLLRALSVPRAAQDGPLLSRQVANRLLESLSREAARVAMPGHPPEVSDMLAAEGQAVFDDLAAFLKTFLAD